MADNLINGIINFYYGLVGIFPEGLKFIPPLFFISVSIALYGVFIWLFYRFLAEKDVLKLDLRGDSPKKKPVHILLYTLEFIIISPIIIFIWFSIFSTFMIILAKDVEIENVMLICAGIISAVRICAYFKEDLSKEIAKLIPFNLLAIAILTQGFLNIETSINRITEVSLFFDKAAYYLLFIIVLEGILRLAYIPVLWVKSKEEK